MIASLGMYLRPETQAATDRYWHLIRDNLRADGIDAPDDLARDGMFWGAWQSPDLLFSQTCGRPYRLKLHDQVALIGTPDFGLPDCKPGYYRSVFLVRSDDKRQSLVEYRHAKFAYNEELSQSGWAAPQCHVDGLGFQFENRIQSGGHKLSALAVVEGVADITAVDALTWEIISEYEAFPTNLRVLDQTDPSPGLPYITGKNQNAERINQAVSKAITNLTSEDQKVLHLKGLVSIPKKEYQAVPNPA